METAARFIELPCHRRDDGEVVVAEAAAQVPFAIARMFTLTAPAGAVRGNHAHRRCSQFMQCVHGIVEVTCSDGHGQKIFVLDRRDRALLVPPGIWNTVTFRQGHSVVTVLCDRPYEEGDYIRDYADYLAFRSTVPA
jgi:dTDP-4-dehydrorhamnose 3,5-epimerase-like enzyme